VGQAGEDHAAVVDVGLGDRVAHGVLPGLAEIEHAIRIRVAGIEAAGENGRCGMIEGELEGLAIVLYAVMVGCHRRW